MARDFEFAAHYNARVHGMKSALFSRAQLEDLLDQEELTLLIEVLLNSPYEKEMAASLSRYEGADAVEDAVSRNLAQTFGRLLKYAQGSFAELARRLFARWDLMAVKTLIRVRQSEKRSLSRVNIS